MHYKETRPSKALAPYLKCYWVLEDPAPLRTMEKVLPDACCELIIHYGDKFRIKAENGKSHVQPRSFVFGPLTRHIVIGPTGISGIIAARFYPGGLAPFLPVPVSQLANRYSSLTALYGKQGSLLEKNILQAGDFAERKQILEEFLLKLLAARPRFTSIIPYELNNLVVNKTEPVKIEYLSKELHIGRRHLERKFADEVGVSPKMLVRIIRFQNIFKILNKKQPVNLTDLTYEAGYYDQSHFNRDFKAFCGVNPKDYFRENPAFTSLFTSGL